MKIECIVCGKMFRLSSGYTKKNAPLVCASCFRRIREARAIGVES